MSLQKTEIIKFIVTHNPRLRADELEKLSISALVIIKVQIELEIQFSNNNNQKP